MVSEQTLAKEKADLVFEQDQYYERYNTKNRFNSEWMRPVNLEIINTLLQTDMIKVAYIDMEGNLFTNFK